MTEPAIAKADVASDQSAATVGGADDVPADAPADADRGGDGRPDCDWM